MTANKLIDDAFLQLIAASAEYLTHASPAAVFADLRYREPAVPPRECNLAAAPRVDLFNENLTPAMKTAYQKLTAELRRFDPPHLLFTSLEPGQGVSFTAGNIAAQWARESPAEKILYAEFFIGGADNDQFTDRRGEIFSDARQLEKYLCFAPTQKIFHLRVCAATAKFDDRAEWWERLTATFDRLFFDASPLNYNPLAARLAKQCRGAAIVAHHPPDGNIIEKTGEEFERLGGRLLGVILNAAEA